MAKTIEQLKAQSAEVKNASVIGENTATRVGSLFNDIVEHVEAYEAGQAQKDTEQSTSINEETARATAAETTLSERINQEVTERKAMDETIGVQLSNEIERAKEMELKISTKLDGEIKRATEAENNLQEKITSEAEARDLAINAEAQARTQNDQLLSQAIAAERERAEAAEQGNATAINSVVVKNEEQDQKLSKLEKKIGNTVNEEVIYNELANLKWDGTQVSASNSNFNAIIIPLESGRKYKLSSPLNSDGLASAITFSSMPILGLSSYSLSVFNNEFVATDNDKYLLVTLFINTVQTATLCCVSGTGINGDIYYLKEANAIEESNIVENADVINQYALLGKMTMKACNLRVNSGKADNATSIYNGYIVYMPAGVTKVTFDYVANGFSIYAHTFLTSPAKGDTGTEMTKSETLYSTTYSVLENTSGLYVLVTVNLSYGSIDKAKLRSFDYNNVDRIEHLQNALDGYDTDIKYTEKYGLKWDGTEVSSSSSKWDAILIEKGHARFFKMITSYDTVNGFASVTSWKEKPVSGDTNYVAMYSSEVNNKLEFGEDENYLLITFRADISSYMEVMLYYDGIRVEINDINEKIEKSDSVEIIAPNDLYAVIGYDFNLYYDTLVKDLDKGLNSPLNYYVDIECPALDAKASYNTFGVRRERMWQLYPSLTENRSMNIAGDYPLYIKVYNKNGDVLNSKTCTLHIVTKSGLTSAKNILCIGDSITNNGPLVATFGEDFVNIGGTQPTFIGTRQTGGYRHEGYPGYTFERFVTPVTFKTYVFQVPLDTNISVGDVYKVNNVPFTITDIRTEFETTKSVRCDGSGTPDTTGTMVFYSGSVSSDASVVYSSIDIESATPFWNETTNKLDIANYRAEVGMGDSKFDLVYIMLGTNDSLWSIKDMTTAATYAKTLVDAFIEDAGSYATKIVVQLTPADANTISSWQVYPDDAKVSQKIAYWTNYWSLRKKLFDTFTDEVYSGKVWIGQAVLGLDRYYGYPHETFQSCSRISEITEDYHTNSVHPNTSGYQQLGDGYFLQALALLK